MSCVTWLFKLGATMPKYTFHIKQGLSLIAALATFHATPLWAQADQAEHTISESTRSSASPEVELNQAELDQILAPIALYPDTLLSHILVAATYPLEIVQAARWRKANQDLDEEQALNAVEDKDWDPSVKALVPFHDLLQKFSDDLDWLQALGDAFLSNEAQVLASVQNLRQKAYANGNLKNNEYLEVAQEDEQITIQTVHKEVIYVPYYDTRVVYGNWWWDAYPPYYWHSPNHYVWHSGFYWSPRYYIRPAFYYGGFRWHDRYVFVDYRYRTHAHRRWSNDTYRQVVRNREYSRWQHDQKHRRGVHYTTNGKVVSREYVHTNSNPNRYVSSNRETSVRQRQQIDKQRVLDLNRYPAEKSKSQLKPLYDEKSARQVQQQLKVRNTNNDKQRLIDQSSNQQRLRVVNNNQPHVQNTTKIQDVPKQRSYVDSTKTQRSQQKQEQRQYHSNRDRSSDSARQQHSARHIDKVERSRSSHGTKTERRVKD